MFQVSLKSWEKESGEDDSLIFTLEFESEKKNSKKISSHVISCGNGKKWPKNRLYFNFSISFLEHTVHFSYFNFTFSKSAYEDPIKYEVKVSPNCRVCLVDKFLLKQTFTHNFSSSRKNIHFFLDLDQTQPIWSFEANNRCAPNTAYVWQTF